MHIAEDRHFALLRTYGRAWHSNAKRLSSPLQIVVQLPLLFTSP
jgi:hypothetical protein